jgi:hypothetical protein
LPSADAFPPLATPIVLSIGAPVEGWPGWKTTAFVAAGNEFISFISALAVPAGIAAAP